jgi:adenylylsulfate kinase
MLVKKYKAPSVNFNQIADDQVDQTPSGCNSAHDFSAKHTPQLVFLRDPRSWCGFATFGFLSRKLTSITIQKRYFSIANSSCLASPALLSFVCKEPDAEGGAGKQASMNSARLLSPAALRQAEPVAFPCAPSLGLVAWLTGLSGAGKSTIAGTTCAELLALGLRVQILDADEVRKTLNRDLGFSRADRDENVRRIGYIANLLSAHGVIVLVAAIAPYREARDQIRTSSGGRFLEVFVSAPLAVCEKRDPKGLYRKARLGILKGLTGIDDPYEEPLAPEVVCNTDMETLKESAGKVTAALLSALALK